MDTKELLNSDAGSAHNFEPDLPEQQSSQESIMPSNRLRHNESFDSIFDDGSDRQSISSNQSDSIPLIAHNTFNPAGTNDMYSVVLIINAALGAGTRLFITL